MAVHIPDEIECWQKITEGDETAFRHLFTHCWEPLFQYAYKILRSRQDAEELVQELFLYLWQKRNQLPQVTSVAAYLGTALKNRLLNHLSRKIPATIPVEQSAAAHQVHTTAATGSEGVLRSLSMRLPEKMRYVYIRHQLEGSSIREIASDTGNSEQTIRNQLSHAIKKMSLLYKEQVMAATLLVVLSLC